ncbi:MAG: hypothetical protein ACRD10_14375 [Terriglobia bacterium]
MTAKLTEFSPTRQDVTMRETLKRAFLDVSLHRGVFARGFTFLRNFVAVRAARVLNPERRY